MNPDDQPSTSKKSREYKPREFQYPVTFDEFMKYVNVEHFVLKDMERAGPRIYNINYKKRHLFYPDVYKHFYLSKEAREKLFGKGLTMKALPRSVKDKLMLFPCSDGNKGKNEKKQIRKPKPPEKEPTKVSPDKKVQSKSSNVKPKSLDKHKIKPLIAEAQKITDFFTELKLLRKTTEVKEDAQHRKRKHEDDHDAEDRKRHKTRKHNTTTHQENTASRRKSISSESESNLQVVKDRLKLEIKALHRKSLNDKVSAVPKPKPARRKGNSLLEVVSDDIEIISKPDVIILSDQEDPQPIPKLPKRNKSGDFRVPTASPQSNVKNGRSTSESEIPPLQVSGQERNESRGLGSNEIHAWLERGVKALEEDSEVESYSAEYGVEQYTAISKLKAIKSHPAEVKKYIKYLIHLEIQKGNVTPSQSTPPRGISRTKVVRAISQMFFEDYLQLINAKKIFARQFAIGKPHHVIFAELRSQHEGIVSGKRPWPRGIYVKLSALRTFLESKGLKEPVELRDIPPRLLSFEEVLENTNLKEYTSLSRAKPPESYKSLLTLCQREYYKCCVQLVWKDGMQLTCKEKSDESPAAVGQSESVVMQSLRVHNSDLETTQQSVAVNSPLDQNDNIEKVPQISHQAPDYEEIEKRMNEMFSSMQSTNQDLFERNNREPIPNRPDEEVDIIIDDSPDSAGELLNKMINPPNPPEHSVIPTQELIPPSPNLFQSSGGTDPKTSQPQQDVRATPELVLVSCNRSSMNSTDENSVTLHAVKQGSVNADPFAEINTTQEDPMSNEVVKQEPSTRPVSSPALDDSIQIVELPPSKPIVIEDEETAPDLLDMLLCRRDLTVTRVDAPESFELMRWQSTSCMENFMQAQRFPSTLCLTTSEGAQAAETTISADADSIQCPSVNPPVDASREGPVHSTPLENDQGIAESPKDSPKKEENTGKSEEHEPVPVYFYVSQNGSIFENVEDVNVVSLIKVSPDNEANDDNVSKMEAQTQPKCIESAHSNDPSIVGEVIEKSDNDSEKQVLTMESSGNQQQQEVAPEMISDEVRLVQASLIQSLNMITQTMDNPNDSSEESDGSDISAITVSSVSTMCEVSVRKIVHEEKLENAPSPHEIPANPPSLEEAPTSVSTEKLAVEVPASVPVDCEQNASDVRVERKTIDRESLARAVVMAYKLINKPSVAMEPDKPDLNLEQATSSDVVMPEKPLSCADGEAPEQAATDNLEPEALGEVLEVPEVGAVEEVNMVVTEERIPIANVVEELVSECAELAQTKSRIEDNVETEQPADGNIAPMGDLLKENSEGDKAGLEESIRFMGQPLRYIKPRATTSGCRSAVSGPSKAVVNGFREESDLFNGEQRTDRISTTTQTKSTIGTEEYTIPGLFQVSSLQNINATDTPENENNFIQVPIMIERRYLEKLPFLQDPTKTEQTIEVQLGFIRPQSNETPNPSLSKGPMINSYQKSVKVLLSRESTGIERTVTKHAANRKKKLNRLAIEARLKSIMKQGDILTVKTKVRATTCPKKSNPQKPVPVKPQEQPVHAFRSLPLEIGKKPPTKEASEQQASPTPVEESANTTHETTQPVASSTVSQILGTDCTYFECSQLLRNVDNGCAIEQPSKLPSPPPESKVIVSERYILSEGIVARKVFRAGFRWMSKCRTDMEICVRVNDHSLTIRGESVMLMYNFSPKIWSDIGQVLQEIGRFDYVRMKSSRYRAQTPLHKVLWHLFDTATQVVNVRIVGNGHSPFSICEKMGTIYPKPRHCLTKAISPDILNRMKALKENLRNNNSDEKETDFMLNPGQIPAADQFDDR